MNNSQQHLAIYTTGNKKIFIYDLDEDTTKYNIHESLKYKHNYSITIDEFIRAVKLYKKICNAYADQRILNCKKTLRVIYMTYWLETFRVKQRFYLEKWGAGMDFGKTVDSFCNILSRFCDGFHFCHYEYYLNISKYFEKNDFIPEGLLKYLIFKGLSYDYSNDVFLDDIVDENGRLLAKKSFIKKYKKIFPEIRGPGMHDNEEEEYEFISDNEEILIRAP